MMDELVRFLEKGMSTEDMALAIFGCPISQLNWEEREMLYAMSRDMDKEN